MVTYVGGPTYAPYPPPPGGYGAPSYGAPAGAVPMTNDAYNQGYTQGTNMASPYANQMNTAATGISGATSGIFSIFTSLFSAISSLLGSIINMVTGLFGGAGGLFGGGGTGQQMPGTYGPNSYFLQGIPAAAPGRPDGQPFNMNQALNVTWYKVGQVRSPQEAAQVLQQHAKMAEDNWINALKLCDQAREKSQQALKIAQKMQGVTSQTQRDALRGELNGARQEVISLMKRAEEYTLAVYDEALFTHLAFNMLVGPYGRFPNAGMGGMQKIVQETWGMWLGGTKPDLWDRVKLFFKGVDHGPAQQIYTKAYQEVDQILAQSDAIANGR